MKKVYSGIISKSKAGSCKQGLLLLATSLFLNLGAQAQSEFTLPALQAEHGPKLKSEGTAARSFTKPNNRLAGVVFRPGTFNQYKWTTQWNLSYTHTYTYNSNARITGVLTNDAVTNQNYSRETYNYDSQNNISEEKYESWSGGTWNQEYWNKYFNTYDAAGNITEWYSQFYSTGPQSSWVNSNRVKYTFNGANKITEQTEELWNGSAWIFVSPDNNNPNAITKIVYNYNANNTLVQQIYQQYINGSFVNFSRYSDFVFTPDNKYQTYTYYRWNPNTNSWEPGTRQTYTYGANGSYVIVTEIYTNGVWQNNRRTTQDFDSHLQDIRTKVEVWNNNQWNFSSENRNLNTYDASDNLTELIRQYYNAGTQAYTNSFRYTYGNFQSFNIAGLHKTQLSTGINIFPNPTHNYLTIKANAAALREITLLDVTGKVVLKQKLPKSNPEPTLDISALPAGLYTLQVQTDKGIRYEKIVKN